MTVTNQSEVKLASLDNHWLNTAEIVAVVGSFGGSVAAFFLKEIVLASLPLSACVALNLINRQRLLKLAATENEQAIATLAQQEQKERGNLSDRLEQIQKSVGKYEETNDQLIRFNSNANERINTLEQNHVQSTSAIEKIALIQSYREPIEDNADSIEMYCRNGDGYQQLGEQQKAIREYTQAIEHDPSCARAYAARGKIYAHLGQKQTATADLRISAKLYFEQGDLDRYQKVKQKIQNIHQLDSDNSKSHGEQVLADNLFT